MPRQLRRKWGLIFTFDISAQTDQAARLWRGLDGLNRQCTRDINGNTTFSVWDGWDIAEEYTPNNVLNTSYVHGAGSDELVSMTRGGQTYYFYQDGRGNTSQLSDPSGNLLESYKYDLNGNPSFYDAAGNGRTSSAYNNRFLFTGREYYQELGLYNYRNRFYSPALNRFLQPDPIGFRGDRSNLYRYCRNNPVNWRDPPGLEFIYISEGKGDSDVWYGSEPAQTGDNNGTDSNYLSDPNSGQGDRVTVGGEPNFNGGDSNGNPGGAPGGVPGGVPWGVPGGFGGPGGFPGGREPGIGPGGNHHGPGNSHGGRPGGMPGGSPTGLFPGLRAFYGPSWAPFFNFVETPASAASAAFTDKGRIPTLVATGLILAPLAVPESGLYATYAAYNAAFTAYNSVQYYGAVGVGYALTNPAETADFTTGVFNIPGDTFAPTSIAGVYGWLGHYLNPLAYPDD